MASEKEIAEAQSWYISRNVDLRGREIDILPAEVHGQDGSSLQLLAPAEPEGSSHYAIRAYDAILVVPGLVKAKLPVELEITPFSGNIVEFAIRPTFKTLRYPISTDRYFEAAWNVLETLTAMVADGELVEDGAKAA